MNSYRKALGLAQRLAARDGADPRVLRTLATSYSKLGDAQVETGGDVRGGIETLRQAARVAEAVSARRPAEEPDLLLLIRVYRVLGDAQLKVRDSAAGLQSYRQALALTERMAQEFPSDPTQYHLTLSLVRVGEGWLETGDLTAAIDHYRRALAIGQGLVERHPLNQIYRRGTRHAHTWLGNLAGGLDTFNVGDRAAALDHYRRALAIAEEIAAADAKNASFQHDLALCYAKVGDLISEADPARGAELYRRALAIIRALVAREPTGFRFLNRQALFLQGLATALRRRGDRQGALESLRQSLKTLQVMSDQSPANAEVHAGRHAALLGLGETLLEMGNHPAAQQHYRQAIAQAEASSSVQPPDLRALWRLADSYSGFGRFHATLAAKPKTPAAQRADAWREARAWYQKSLDAWDGWGRHGVSSVFNTTKREQVARDLARCEAALSRPAR
jgi:tetratricopeptide (TPR) repeat protein